ncbi:enoyl-CoA hydratase/isomerase family protein [Dietzia aurantiaca]|uniref:enoyl-CoA hydratase-related protein n=1 Tax=Dietzia aurantiaca TaxID=983873 RepID=UPI001E4F982A|nr:enoyl-CoA hydratase-related protein [Dietzia aurantiaca]MCD2262126.1 enoyl-CoA hydratase/isomerase family protein [Dietzia aurantiaca]
MTDTSDRLVPPPLPDPATPPSLPDIAIERDSEIAIIRLEKPDKLNAVTDRNLRDLIRAFDAVDADDSILAVVLTGTGRAFCAGADLSGGVSTFVAEAGAAGEVPADTGGLVSLRIYRMSKPVIAAINGPAAGVGVTMTLPADVRIAAENARFGFVFTRRGLVPEACSTWFLPRIVGISTAVEWTMGARMVPADEALERGLVRELVPAGNALARAIEVARDMVAGTAPVSVALTRALMWRMLGAAGPEEAHAAESVGIFTRGASADVREGVEAFLVKREPAFPDHIADGLPDLFG